MDSFYRQAQGLRLSTLGIGTYLGAMNDTVDENYRQSIADALRGGITVVDTSLNYRHQRSERAIARGLIDWGGNRNDVVLCTKAGYLVPDAVPAGSLRPEDVAQGIHSMAPAFLDDQLTRSLSNLGVDQLDVFYLHNPETQLAEVDEETFYARIRAAFEFCERAAAKGRIKFYGTATWDAFRKGDKSVSLRRLDAIASEIAGPNHKFRFIQLPVNLGMHEAITKPVEPNLSILDIAVELDITAVASASLLQARLLRGKLPAVLADTIGGATDVLQVIQFTRSAPGVTVALVGMSNPEHVAANLEIRNIPPATLEQFRRLFQ